MGGSIISAKDASFESDVIQSHLPVLLYFGAVWCGPCKGLEPIVDSLAGDYAGRAKIVKVDVDACPEIRKRYSVMGVPQMLIIKAGETVANIGRVRTKTALSKLLDSHIASAPEETMLAENLSDPTLRSRFLMEADPDHVRRVLRANPHYVQEKLEWGTPIQTAIMGQKLDRVQLLLEFEPELTVSDMAGAGLAEALKTALQDNPNLANGDGSGPPPLYTAIRCSQIETIDVLLEAGAAINWAPEKDTRPYLLELGRHKDARVLRHLLAKGLDVHVSIGRGDTVLHWAAASGSAEVVGCLLNEGLDPSVRNDAGETAIDLAEEAIAIGIADTSLVELMQAVGVI